MTQCPITEPMPTLSITASLQQLPPLPNSLRDLVISPSFPTSLLFHFPVLSPCAAALAQLFFILSQHLTKQAELQGSQAAGRHAGLPASAILREKK